MTSPPLTPVHAVPATKSSKVEEKKKVEENKAQKKSFFLMEKKQGNPNISNKIADHRATTNLMTSLPARLRVPKEYQVRLFVKK